MRACDMLRFVQHVKSLPQIFEEGGRTYSETLRLPHVAVFERSGGEGHRFCAWRVEIISGTEERGELLASGNDLDALTSTINRGETERQ